MCYVVGMFNPFKRLINWLMMNDDFEITEVDPVGILEDPKTPEALKDAIREAKKSPLSEEEIKTLAAKTRAAIKAEEDKLPS
jgi:hypothetical protein